MRQNSAKQPGHQPARKQNKKNNNSIAGISHIVRKAEKNENPGVNLIHINGLSFFRFHFPAFAKRIPDIIGTGGLKVKNYSADGSVVVRNSNSRISP